MDNIAQLLYLYGIGYEYHKYTGDHVVFDHQTRLQALQECGVDVSNPDEIDRLNFELDIAKWLTPVEAITLVCKETPTITIRVDDGLHINELTVSIPALGYCCVCDPNKQVAIGDYRYQDTRYVQFEVPINAIEVGYHSAEVMLNGARFETELWVTPRQCYDPIEQHKKLLGLSIQLYSLKPAGSKLSADFYELKQLVEASAAEGVDYILLNPLHLLFVDKPEKASPYSPNDRRLLHPFYISIELLCEQFGLDVSVFADYLDVSKSNLSATYLNMTHCMESKLNALRFAWQLLCDQTGAWRADFARFCQAKQQELKAFEDDDFAKFLQWLAFEQLTLCQSLALNAGMAVGLINDLAVGCADGSSEYNSNKNLYADHARVGAPPDPWAELGQNWGLPALNPVKLKAQRFAFFKQLIQANITGVGALRIDHVMGLRRLWWCFYQEQQQTGCYVYYPFEYLLAILKIESVKHQVMIIGEDLGVVPIEIKEAMSESHIYSNILFYFEKDYHGQFLAPTHYKHNALLMVANHDVPPFFGWWSHDDLRLRREYQLLSEPQLTKADEERTSEREKLCHWLSCYGEASVALASEARDVYQALINVLAKSPAKMLTIQFDDLDEQKLPVNIPGTDQEYPNWRRRLNQTSAEIIASSRPLIRDAITSRKE
ncbi:4-alpha-glucanotransferase [Pseudoalteromonas galatheae]|uniref:4-alpha-glucanotransferase n=1 Tax=Pseudoalteromonas galatheae TaxID=579562 RepID=UPI0030D3DBFE